MSGKFTASYKRFEFLKPGFLSSNVTPFVQESPGPVHMPLWELSWGTRATTDTLTTAVTMSKKVLYL